MESIQNFLNIISALITIIPLILSTITSKVMKKKINDTILQSIAITIFFIVVLPMGVSYEFKTSEEYFETILILYAVVSVALFLSKKVSEKLVEICKSNTEENAIGKTAVASIISFVVFFGLGIFAIYNNFFGINVKFTEDVAVTFIDENNSIYKVKIPKDTVIVLKENDIIDNSQLLKTGINNMRLNKSNNLILFKTSKKLSLKSNVELYFTNEEIYDHLLDSIFPQKNEERKACSMIENKINLDIINSEQETVEFLSDTKFLLTKDRDVILLQDTKVEVYVKAYQSLMVLLFVLIAVFIPSILIYNHILLYSRKKSKIEIMTEKMNNVIRKIKTKFF